MDKLGAVSPAKSVDVVVEWPTLPSERAVTDASAEKLAAAESGAVYTHVFHPPLGVNI